MKSIFFAALAAIFLIPSITGPLFAAPPEFDDRGKKNDNALVKHDELFSLYQPYLDNISGYKPVYFLVGAKPENSKFQFSFKYRFISPETRIAQNHLWVRGFHIAYTQTSFWNLKDESKPFEDSSYKPELFFLSSNLFSGKNRSHAFIQTGFEHESNGQAESNSRSTNYIYIKPIYAYFHEKTGLGFQVAPKIWTYVANSESSNPDIDKYRGHFDLEFKFGRADLAVVEMHWRWAEKGHSISIDLTYPMDRLTKISPQLYLHVQYVNGLAESLLDYTKRNEALRIGISVVR